MANSIESYGKQCNICNLKIDIFFTAQYTLVQMRGLGIACRLSVCL